MAKQRLMRTAAAVTLAAGLLVPAGAIGAFGVAQAATPAPDGQSASTDGTTSRSTGTSEPNTSAESGESATAGAGAGKETDGSPTSGGTGGPESGIQDGPRSAVGGARLASTATLVAGDAPDLPSGLTADAFVVADADTGDVYASRDAHGRFAPGSALTALTGLALLPKLDPADKVTPTTAMTVDEGPQAGLKAGTAYPVDDLMYALFMLSANDAANALVGAAPGGSRVGIAAVNAEAKRLQANDTVLVNAGGVDAAGQTTSTYDLALVAREGLGNRAFAKYVGTRSHTIDSGSSTLQLVNRNRQLAVYEGMTGTTTATTNSGTGTYVASATQDGRTLIVALLSTEGAAPAQATKLLDWGFALPAEASGVTSGETSGQPAGAAAVEPVGKLVSPTTSAVATFLASGTDTTKGSTTAGEKESSGLGFGSEAALSLLLVVIAGAVVVAGFVRTDRSTAAVAAGPQVPAPRADDLPPADGPAHAGPQSPSDGGAARPGPRGSAGGPSER